MNIRISVAIAVILGTVSWLAYSGYGSSKSYYVTISELNGMGNKAYRSNLRVEGFVQPDSIVRNGPRATFVLNEFESHSLKSGTGRLLKVVYQGSDPPPDTFTDNAQALAAGRYGRDGVFYASELQAKCASKYAPTQPGTAPAKVASGSSRADASASPSYAAPHRRHG